jgi:large subunit ribosomal protein L9
MQVILKQDVLNLGSKDDIVNVKDGYARNYLIPRGMAMTATPSSKKMHSELLRQRAHKEAKIIAEAQVQAEKMKGLKLTLGAKTSSKGKIFGSVNTIQLAESLAAKGYDIDRKQILIKEDLIKEIGTYTAKIKLHKEVYVEIEFEIVSE